MSSRTWHNTQVVWVSSRILASGCALTLWQKTSMRINAVRQRSTAPRLFPVTLPETFGTPPRGVGFFARSLNARPFGLAFGHGLRPLVQVANRDHHARPSYLAPFMPFAQWFADGSAKFLLGPVPIFNFGGTSPAKDCFERCRHKRRERVDCSPSPLPSPPPSGKVKRGVASGGRTANAGRGALPKTTLCSLAQVVYEYEQQVVVRSS
jgi:hypothetical protein